MEGAEPEKQQRVETRSSIQRKPFSDLTNLIPKPNCRSTSISQSKKPTMGSSILRKPLSNLTNHIPEPQHHSTSFSQSKKHVKSGDPAMSVSSTGSTQIHGLVQHQFTVPRDQHPTPTPRTPSPVTLNVSHAQKRQYDSIGDGKRIPYNGTLTMVKTRSKINATAIATLINYDVNGAENSVKSKSAKVPLLTNKKRSRSSKGSSKKYVLPQDFIDQQRAYFKEIDEYELQVEETDDVSN